ncbi:MAG: hypothetical protein GX591_11780 [Planctomycetes bacterium]|nr:hypothetical protein [Planctomycetota bacterium]
MATGTDNTKEQRVTVSYTLPASLLAELESYVAVRKYEDRLAGRPVTTRSGVVEDALRDHLKKHPRDRRG